MSECEARSKMYQVFSALLTHPDEDLWSEIKNGTISKLLVDIAKQLPFKIPALEGDIDWEVDDLTAEDLSILYTSNFEIGNAPVSLYERNYSKSSDAELFEDLFRIYEYFGITFSDDKEPVELPDYLSTELEFMHYLSYIEAKTEGDSKSFIKAQRDFLTRHLSLCTAGFENKAREKGLNVYATLGDIVKDFVESDLLFLTQKAA